MRPLRLVLLLSCFVALPIFLTFISLATAHPRNGGSIDSASRRASRLRALFNFQTPSSLFPPSAMISLTDDNTTFFIAKPADFGPALPAKGLNGQLWIGAGFGEDVLREDGVLTSAEGELGCSDVPNWDEDSKNRPTANPANANEHKSAEQDKTKTGAVDPAVAKHLDAAAPPNSQKMKETEEAPIADDGTDDHLHHPLPGSGIPTPLDTLRTHEERATGKDGKVSAHADIQSLQESAEIAGKIVLLSRGGCGFLEKVKWAQRRGAVAVIVGDNVRHGSLVTMYARGDTSNITIPSVFTSHTTAHLLASLMPPETLAETADAKTDAAISLKKPSPGTEDASHPNAAIAKGTESTSEDLQSPLAAAPQPSSSGWVTSLLNSMGLSDETKDPEEDSRRPPSSGNIDWVLVEDFEEEDSKAQQTKPKKSSDKGSENPTSKSSKQAKDNTKHGGTDDFVIGEQDWRDPDLLKSDHKLAEDEKAKAMSKSTKEKEAAHQDDSHANKPKGGSITPGSGEYSDLGNSAAGDDKRKTGKASTSTKSKSSKISNGWLSWFSSSHQDNQSQSSKSSKESQKLPQTGKKASKVDGVASAKENVLHREGDHEGLWVTLTPTSMSTSPFLDTLLVLVVSPLVTLTVVYTMLLLRSRIRRRRWRAPKSVVDRLPVRTYHTMATSAVTSQLSSPESSSPTTPLLRATASSRSRPRSRNASSVPNSSTSPEKPRNGTPWRRRFKGRQVECVVCLEEYIDGQSRVMSLPCGHEFHVECITPWLTTRRRTCPICKGDVVRSMAQMDSSSFDDDEDAYDRSDDVQDLVAETRNDSPSAAIPIPRGEGEDDEDVERGEPNETTSLNNQTQVSRRGWWNILNLPALTSDSLWAGRQTPVDRNR